MIIILFKVMLSTAFIARLTDQFLLAVVTDPNRYMERVIFMLLRDQSKMPTRIASLCMAGIWGGALWLLWA